MHLHFMKNPVSLMKSIIKRETTFENNSDMEVKVRQKKSSRAFVKETQWSKTCSTVKSTLQAKHRGGVSPRSKCPSVRYVCPILNLCIIISSRRGERNMLITFILGSIECSLFSVLPRPVWIYQRYYETSTSLGGGVEYVWVICNPNEGQPS